MATNWQTYPIEFRGGLISNLGDLQHGTAAPGSATILQNYEPSKDGGYKKVLGFTKVDSAVVPGDTTKPVLGVKAISETRTIASRENTDTPSVTQYYYSDGSGWTSLVKAPSLGNKARSVSFTIANSDYTIFVDGVNYPSVYDHTANTLTFMTSSDSSDVSATSHVAYHKTTAFYGSGTKLIFTAPFSYDDFSAANGAGVIDIGSEITGLVSFRDQLIIFSQDSVKRLVGNTTADFQVQPITERIGCLDPDTIQEVGGDIMYLAPDGLRLLSATDRIGDFGLDIASAPIAKEIYEFVTREGITFSSVVVREKAQYRVFAYKSGERLDSARGFLATKFSDQGAASIQWSELVGFKVHVSDSAYIDYEEYIYFANETGYVYRMEEGYDRDGSNIKAVFETPFMPITDPKTRKSFYKIALYINPIGEFDTTLNVKYDYIKYNKRDVIQPSPISMNTGTGAIAYYGTPSALYGTSTYGGTPESVLREPLIGSGRNIALRFTDDSTNATHTLDSAILEFMQHDRQ